MNLFARILSHGFALVVVAMLAIGLIYRGELFPGMELPGFLAFERAADSGSASTTGAVDEDTPDAGEQAVAETDPLDGMLSSAAAPDAADSAGEQQSADAAMATPAMLEESAPAPGPAEDAVDSTPSAAEAATEAAALPPAALAESAPAPSPVEAAVDSTPSVAAVAREAADDVQVAADRVDENEAASSPVEASSPEAIQADTAAGSVPAQSPYQLLAAAREAYWLRDYVTAEQNYQAMIDADPGNPDGYGELGNMYFSQGKWELASTAYFEAGKRLADDGLVEQARQLVDVIKGLQGSQAGELEQYIGKSASVD